MLGFVAAEPSSPPGAGDPDLTDDELQAAIDRAQAKRSELVATQSTRGVVKMLNMLPRAAETYRKQVVAGLDGHSDAMIKARQILRESLGAIQLKIESDGSLRAEYSIQPAALIRAQMRMVGVKGFVLFLE